MCVQLLNPALDFTYQQSFTIPPESYNFHSTIFITVIPQPVYMNSQELFSNSSKIEKNPTVTDGCCLNNSLQSVAENVPTASPCIVTSTENASNFHLDTSAAKKVVLINGVKKGNDDISVM